MAIQHHTDVTLPDLHKLLIEVVAAMDRFARDEEMLSDTCLSRERALFPLLTLIERFGPIGVAALGRQVNRDNTTISRQVARLEVLGLVERRMVVRDQRVRAACITAKGKAIARAVDAARRHAAQSVFEFWDPRDLSDLERLLNMLRETVSTLKSTPPGRTVEFGSDKLDVR